MPALKKVVRKRAARKPVVRKRAARKPAARKRAVKQKACPEGKKMTKTGGRCIQDKGYKPKGQRQTVCLQGYRISKSGACIKDKKGQAPAQRQTVCLEGYRISKNGKCIKDKDYKIVVQQGPERRPTGFQTAKSFGPARRPTGFQTRQSRGLSVAQARAPSFADYMRARSADF